MPIQITSSQDKISYTVACEEQLLKFSHEWLRRREEPLEAAVPQDILAAMKIWRSMAQRYKLDMLDCQTGLPPKRPPSWHTREEQTAEMDMAQWLNSKWHEIRGTVGDEPFYWHVLD